MEENIYRKDFPFFSDNKYIYLDNAATTQRPKVVLDAICDFYKKSNANPLRGLYDIKYESGLQAFGYKNAYGVQMNYLQDNSHRSGFIVFGYANTTDPAPINRLFDYYDCYQKFIQNVRYINNIPQKSYYNWS